MTRTRRVARGATPFLVLATVLAAVLSACGGGAAASVTPPPGADVSIDAKNGQFTPTEVTAPAGQPFELFFRNLDAEPHNVAILAAGSGANADFHGEVITNAATTYAVPALAAGRYTFRCDVHQNMTGTIVAG